MEELVKGLHHITLVTGVYEVNRRFYTEVLGLRQVKLSVNQDDVFHRHVFYANPEKPTGSAITFFEWPELPHGFSGLGSPHHLAYRVGSLEGLAKWYKWLKTRGLKVKGPFLYDGLASLYFCDPDSVLLELCTDVQGSGRDYVAELLETVSEPREVDADMRILRFDHASPIITSPELTKRFYEKFLGVQTSEVSVIGGKPVLNVKRETDTYLRCLVDSLADDGYVGRGSIHHVAFAVESEEEQRGIMRRLNLAGFVNSGIVDRFWFKSLYFRDPDGNLLEVATVGPGYDVDEPRETLGSRLVLPPWLEPMRKTIEQRLSERDALKNFVWPPEYGFVEGPPEPFLADYQ